MVFDSGGVKCQDVRFVPGALGGQGFFLEGLARGPLVPRCPGPRGPCFPARGSLVLRSLLRSRAFPTFCYIFVLALWFLWRSGLRVPWSPGHPIPLPLVFWFSSPVVFWSPDTLILWSSTRFVSQFLGRLVLWSSCCLVLWL